MRLISSIVLAILLAVSGVSAQVGFPAEGMRAVNELYAGVNPQDDGARRVAIVKVCEQMQFDLGETWVNKVRTGLDPKVFLSPDSIAHQNTDGSLDIWDVQASSGQILVFEGKLADHPNIPPGEGAAVDCTATNHLGTAPPPPDPTDPALEARVTALEANVNQLSARADLITAVVDRLTVELAALTGRVSSLESRPVPVECRASALGIPLSCRLVF